MRKIYQRRPGLGLRLMENGFDEWFNQRGGLSFDWKDSSSEIINHKIEELIQRDSTERRDG